jgi:hypothetical protein
MTRRDRERMAIMGYENAPATTLVATNCACCGRALVDAVSVETGIGPECRKKFGIPSDASEDARTEANKIVFLLARGGLAREDARPMFDRLNALGFELLAARVAKRFRTTLEVGPSVSELRATYANLLRGFTYDNIKAVEFNALVKASLVKTTNNPTPAHFVACAEAMRCPCRRCAGTGSFITRVENGEPRGPGGICFRCEGKGYQTAADGHRNRTHDEHHMARRVA